MAFLVLVSLPQLNASPSKAEAGLIGHSDSSKSTGITSSSVPDQSTVTLPTQKAAAEEKEGSTIYKTFTDSDYSLDAINSALASCPNGQEVKLEAGTYSVNGIIQVPAGKTLSGSVDEEGNTATIISTSLVDDSLRLNGCINIGEGGNMVKNIKTENGFFFSGVNSHDFVFQDCEYNGPTDASAGQLNLCGFIVYFGSNGNYDNGKFVSCLAKNAPGFGFLVSADSGRNSNHLGANSYSAHGWTWENCQAYECGIANIKFPGQFIYGCGYDFFEGLGPQDTVAGMRISNCTANGNAADGFHIEYMMDIQDAIFKNCTADDNGQWFRSGHSTNPGDGVLIGTGFYLGGSDVSQTRVLDSKTNGNWGYSTQGGGHGIVDSQKQTDKTGVHSQAQGADSTTANEIEGKETGSNASVVQNHHNQKVTKVTGER